MHRLRSPPTDGAAGVRAMAGDLAGLLATAEALASAGRAIDLRGLGDLAGRLCAASLDLPGEQGRAMRPALADLAARIQRLQQVLTPDAGP